MGLLCAVGHNAILSDDVLIDIWEKVAFNAALNTTTAITGLTVGGVGSCLKAGEALFDHLVRGCYGGKGGRNQCQ